MKSSHGALLAIGWIVSLTAALDAHAAPVVVPPRPGQVGLGIQGQYGTMLKSGSLGAAFASGPGLAVRLRYRMRFERGLGLSFENQGFDVRNQGTDSSRATIFTAGAEVYQMFGTRTRTTTMISVGVGLAKSAIQLKSGETGFPFGDGPYASLGAGVERFFWQSWAYDLSARYMTVFQDGKANHDLQLALGVIFYGSY